MFGNKKRKEEELLRDIQRLYWKLNEIVKSLYKLKNCTKCGGHVMNIHVISPSGKSIEYSCENCGEVMACTIIDGKDPGMALHLQNTIKSKMEELYSLIGEEIHKREIDITFKIN